MPRIAQLMYSKIVIGDTILVESRRFCMYVTDLVVLYIEARQLALAVEKRARQRHCTCVVDAIAKEAEFCTQSSTLV